MDKTQRGLVDTYIRKREIATGDNSYGMYGERGGINPYELLYIINNNIVNPEKVNGNNISELIKYNPKLYYNDKVKPFLDKMSIGNISNLLQHRPEFMDVIDGNIINEMDGDSIALIVGKNPQLIDRFDLSKMKSNNVRDLLIKQPQFVDRFEKELNSFGDGWYKDMFWRDFKGFGLRDENDSKKQRKVFLNAMVNYPQYRLFFKDQLKKETYIDELLKLDYSLLNYFDLSILNSNGLDSVLKAFPNLITKFTSKQLNSIEDYRLEWLLRDRPELKPYFDKAKSSLDLLELKEYINNNTNYNYDTITKDEISKLIYSIETKIENTRNNREYDYFNNIFRLLKQVK